MRQWTAAEDRRSEPRVPFVPFFPKVVPLALLAHNVANGLKALLGALLGEFHIQRPNRSNIWLTMNFHHGAALVDV